MVTLNSHSHHVSHTDDQPSHPHNVRMSPLSNAKYWLPEGVNPPCTCEGHQHRPDDDGNCDKPNDNDPASWGYCACQHSSSQPVTMEEYKAWQADIRAGRIRPDDIPSDLGISY